ncbi:hypothetical protein M431DRAFT_495062 [Trichoderma harzianum CBS 226.95]|uniref:Uncharacterized protein n=1 Tax=Trichoderma harzianum CBS 226.95 TaxID=983964 RepID=A0A2T4ACP1_TRIHA|nr:hypothetical protein M431DRAFT_495062 [Trichoderma harzianum CBS 226.95]PTB54841.1 hypothetical protein M431DRAFT_495062 [Trichoderma harzianum CBS 226.95]
MCLNPLKHNRRRKRRKAKPASSRTTLLQTAWPSNTKTRQTAITTSTEQETARRKDNDEVFRRGRWKLGNKGQADGGLSGLATDWLRTGYGLAQAEERLCYCSTLLLKAQDLLVFSLHPAPLQACYPLQTLYRCIIGQGPASVLSSALAQASTPSMLLPVLISGPQSTPKTPTRRVANIRPNNPMACQPPVLQLLLVWQMARWRLIPGRKA